MADPRRGRLVYRNGVEVAVEVQTNGHVVITLDKPTAQALAMELDPRNDTGWRELQSALFEATTDYWRCAQCGADTPEPHTQTEGEFEGEDVCESCCAYCPEQRDADIDQQLKEGRSGLAEAGAPLIGHGLPTREQSAVIEARRRRSHR
jgi:hypothetical protein